MASRGPGSGSLWQPDYTGVVALKKPCNLGTSILMTKPGGLQAWRLAASMKWICVDVMDLGVFWGGKVVNL